MNRAPVIFLTAFLGFAISFGVFIVAPQIQIGRMSLTTVTGGSEQYPKARPGQAAQGADVYRANGCASCHSQQVRQNGMRIDVVLNEAGTNTLDLLAALKALDSKLDAGSLAKLPQMVLANVSDSRTAEKAQAALNKVGAVADVRFTPVGTDIQRGWGLRQSVAADYLFDLPVLLGSLRVGPDLSNVGARLPDTNWQLVHLYNPKALVKDSPMPAYRFLFHTRKITFAPSADALRMPAGFEAPAGFEIVPTDEALSLVAYLQSLRVSAPLYEAPMSLTVSAPQADQSNTNAAAK